MLLQRNIVTRLLHHSIASTLAVLAACSAPSKAPGAMAHHDGFKAISASFMRWLPSTSATVSDKVKLEDLRQRGAGRGLGTSAPAR